MSFKIRRIVTTHDADGKAIIGMDTLIESKPGVKDKNVQGAVLWATREMPVDMSGNTDPAAEKLGLHPSPNGSILRILELPPGAPALMHRTDTIDYVLQLEGECDMILDDDRSEEHTSELQSH